VYKKLTTTINISAVTINNQDETSIKNPTTAAMERKTNLRPRETKTDLDLKPTKFH
jgi:hypothetical protein